MTILVKSRDSLLTTSSGYTNYRGILNLVIILLVLSNARAALENIIKYGILVDPLSCFLFLNEGSKHCPALVIVLALSGHILISLGLEMLIASRLCRQQAHTKTGDAGNRKRSSPVGKEQQQQSSSRSSTIMLTMANATIVLNLIACLSLPPVAVYSHDTHPISTSAALMIVSIVFLKLVSYHMMNYWCRDIRNPEALQSRTTKSFLRSYSPPVVDFGIVDLNNPKGLTAGSPLANKDAKTREGELSGELRQRLNNNNNNTTNSNLNNNIANNKSAKSSPSSSPIKPQAVQQQQQHLSKEEQQVQVREVALRVMTSKYPQNITLKNMCNYMSFPTLCYELEYAQTERIRKRFLIKRIVELIILSQLDIALVQQWIVPTVSNSVIPFKKMQFSHMLERLLKLAIPNHVIWLIWFYLFFHSLLNIIAELTRFADREFYRDWWNSESVYYFWSNWNIPVHKWCARHLYVPLMALGFSKRQASTAVFFVSAFFHEYLVSVPLKLFRMWAFFGMLIQLPWARFVSSYFNNHFANVAVWVSIIIGQPLCILMYYHDYYVINNVKYLRPT